MSIAAKKVEDDLSSWRDTEGKDADDSTQHNFLFSQMAKRLEQGGVKVPLRYVTGRGKHQENYEWIRKNVADIKTTETP